MRHPLPPLAAWAFAACLVVPSVSVVARAGGVGGLAAWAAAVFIVVALLWPRLPPLALRGSERGALAGTVAMLVALAAAFAIGYPLANSGLLGPGGDRDEALTVATTRLLAGQYPYSVRTYLDNPISPMPGALVLAAPFAALGNGAFQVFLWLPLALVVFRATLGLTARQVAAFLAALLVGAPILIYEVVTGSDFWVNSLYVLVALLLLVQGPPNEPARRALCACLFGLTLSSRANFALLLPLVWAFERRRLGGRAATVELAFAIGTLAAVTLPFWLADPATFSPLATEEKITVFDAVFPRAGLLIPLSGALLSLALAWRGPRTLADLLRDGALVLAAPVVVGVLLPIARFGRPFLDYAGRYGSAFLLWSTLACWLAVARGEGNGQT